MSGQAALSVSNKPSCVLSKDSGPCFFHHLSASVLGSRAEVSGDLPELLVIPLMKFALIHQIAHPCLIFEPPY